jgi:archaellum biogenesis ATPase FlaH
MTAHYTEQEFLDQMVALRTGLEEDELWDRISMLPRELKNIIGTYSTRVHTQKMWLRHQFFRKWTVENLDRLLQLIRKWTKRQIIWFMTNCNYFNYTYTVLNNVTDATTRFLILLNKTDLVEQLRKRTGYACDQHFNGKSLYCVFHARKTWQRLHVIDYVDKRLKTRKSLQTKRRKAEKRQREEEEE